MRLFPNIELTSATHWEPPRAEEPYDVIIFDRVTVPALAQGNIILIDTVAPNPSHRARWQVAKSPGYFANR